MPSAILLQEYRRTYPRRENGGARPVLRAQTLTGGDKRLVETSSTATSSNPSRIALAMSAGGLCMRLVQAEPRSPAVCRTVRLLVADSSISARMACKSSDAEITGNNRTRAQAKLSRHCSDVIQRAGRDAPPRRHSQYAGRASNTQTRLSNSSMNEEADTRSVQNSR